eukprot:NODE_640_length_5117_cov_0.610203.p4 type:complete len:128 gc:universal NODE_640_length_5117_cov_0.610203:1221-1604(+)
MLLISILTALNFKCQFKGSTITIPENTAIGKLTSGGICGLFCMRNLQPPKLKHAQTLEIQVTENEPFKNEYFEISLKNQVINFYNLGDKQTCYFTQRKFWVNYGNMFVENGIQNSIHYELNCEIINK